MLKKYKKLKLSTIFRKSLIRDNIDKINAQWGDLFFYSTVSEL